MAARARHDFGRRFNMTMDHGRAAMDARPLGFSSPLFLMTGKILATGCSGPNSQRAGCYWLFRWLFRWLLCWLLTGCYSGTASTAQIIEIPIYFVQRIQLNSQQNSFFEITARNSQQVAT
jgi:hypothetical protein